MDLTRTKSILEPKMGFHLSMFIVLSLEFRFFLLEKSIFVGAIRCNVSLGPVVNPILMHFCGAANCFFIFRLDSQCDRDNLRCGKDVSQQ